PTRFHRGIAAAVKNERVVAAEEARAVNPELEVRFAFRRFSRVPKVLHGIPWIVIDTVRFAAGYIAQVTRMILQNDFKRQWDEVAEKVLGAVRRVGSSGWYILGAEVAAFEKELAAFWGVSHAIGTANGLDALEIGLRCLGLRPGDKVLTTPLSAFATTLAILRAGAVPVFVDVDAMGAIDFAQCRELLARDSSIRYLLPVHLYGRALNLDELKRLQRDFRLHV